MVRNVGTGWLRDCCVIRQPSSGPQAFDYELRFIDIATGAATSHMTDAVEGQLLWLPQD